MGKMPFNQMENIGNYLKFASSVGVKSVDMYVVGKTNFLFLISVRFIAYVASRFQTVDLYEGKNMNQVVHHIHALGRVTQKLPGFNGPYLGVKESDKHARGFILSDISSVFLRRLSVSR